MTKKQPKREVRSLDEWRRTTERRPVPGQPGTNVERIYGEIGAVIREMRERLSVSQQDLANACGWTRAQVSNVEAGRSRIMLHTLPLIATRLFIPVTDLLPQHWRTRVFGVGPDPDKPRAKSDALLAIIRRRALKAPHAAAGATPTASDIELAGRELGYDAYDLAALYSVGGNPMLRRRVDDLAELIAEKRVAPGSSLQPRARVQKGKK